jgi:lipopolysaccharide export system permease protein
MLKNKIYKYIATEIAKSFIIILFAFTSIAWTVKAVNFLDLIVEDGYGVGVYLQYSIINITSILTRFIPLAFLLSIIIAIVKLERQQELLILWTSGVSKLKIVNLLFLLAVIVTVFQILFAVLITPTALNKSRSLLRETGLKEISSIIKSNAFSDSFQNVTFYIDSKNEKGEMINIFIRDNTNVLSSIVSESEGTSNTTIVAERGIVANYKLILFDGIIQTQNTIGKIKNVEFKKTELSIDSFVTRTITEPKIQETSTVLLLECLFRKNNFNIIASNCSFDNNKKDVIENLSRRMGMPIYIPLVSLFASFLLIKTKNKKFNFLNRYVYFLIGFFILVFAEIMVRYSGFSIVNFIIYFSFPILLMPIIYLSLIRNMISEHIGLEKKTVFTKIPKKNGSK